jgi:lipoprotein-anchoring transpeptidase ErfK/SrfK
MGRSGTLLLVHVFVLGLLFLCTAAEALGAFDPGPTRPSGFAVAQVERPTPVRSRPGGPIIGRVAPFTEFGSPTALGVVKSKYGWLRVITAVLRDGEFGWVRATAVRLTSTSTRLTIDLSQHQMHVVRDGRIVRRMRVGVGRASSPTPTGRFVVTDKLSGRGYGPWYGCCIIALSAHQPRLPAGWDGGSRIAIHGTDEPSSVGASSSTGCLHARRVDLMYLMRILGLGTPVFIHA